MTAFLDTNVIIRFVTSDDAFKSKRSAGLLKRAETGEEQLETSHLVIAEVVWVLESRIYSLNPSEISRLLMPIIDLHGLRMPEKELLARSFDLYVETGVDFIDAYNAVTMRKRRIDRIFSYDTDFDALPGVTRIEP